MDHVHSAAQRGFTDQAVAYARGRPDYPPELSTWLKGTLGLAPGRTVVDLGAGTGKFTPLLVATGAKVQAVEPVDAMRAQLAKKLPEVDAHGGSAQAMPLAAGTVDAVVCAQAFHWFADDAALAEIHRVLKPAGKLGLVWNVRDESVDWVKTLTDIVTPYEGDAPRFYKGLWRKPFETTRLFSPLEETKFPYEHVGPPEEVIVDRFMSVSFIAALPAAGQDEVRAQLRHLVATHTALKGRERVAFPYQTSAYLSRRL